MIFFLLVAATSAEHESWYTCEAPKFGSVLVATLSSALLALSQNQKCFGCHTVHTSPVFYLSTPKKLLLLSSYIRCIAPLAVKPRLLRGVVYVAWFCLESEKSIGY